MNHAIQGSAVGILMSLCFDLSFFDAWNFLILLLNKHYFVSIFVTRFVLLKLCLSLSSEYVKAILKYQKVILIISCCHFLLFEID